MSRIKPLAVIAFAAALLMSAHAAVQVVGAGPEKACYDASKSRRPDLRAIAQCDAALEQSALSREDRAATFVNRSVLLLHAQKTRAALRDTDAALEIIPDMPAASVNRAAALIRLERYGEARKLLDRVLPNATGIELTRGLFNRAVAAEALGDMKAAYADYSRIVELDPDFEDAKVELARFQVSQN